MATFDINTASALLEPRIGFRQTIAKKEYLDIDSSLLPDLTNGGEYVNSLSEKFLSIESMSNCLVDNDGFDVDVWAIGTNYVIGNRVRKIVNGRAYTWVAKTNNVGIDPEVDDGTNWKSALSEILENYRNSAAIELINEVISKQNNAGFSTGLRSSTTLYKEKSTPVPVQLKDRFVGICIKPVNAMLNKVITIDKVGLNISGATGIFQLYLYHSSKKEPLQIFDINVDNVNKLDTHIWYDLLDQNSNKLILDMFNPEYNQGGMFYFGAYEEDLVANGQSYNYNDITVTTAFPTYRWFNAMYHDDSYALGSFEVQTANLNKPDLPNIGQYYDGASYNSELFMNIQFRIEQSYYPQISNNITSFQAAYKYKLGINILQDMMRNDRVNRIADNAEVKIDELLFGDPANDNNKGLVAISDEHMKKLMADLDVIFDNYQGAYLGPI